MRESREKLSRGPLFAAEYAPSYRPWPSEAGDDIKEDNLHRTTSHSIEYYRFDNLSAYTEVVHGVFARVGGVSKAPFASLNASLAVEDDREAVIANRELLCQSLSVPYSSLTMTKQVHGTVVTTISDPHLAPSSLAGQPGEQHDALPTADAMITSLRGRTLMMTFADCVPLLFYDPVNHAVGIAHGGWRGTVDKIVERTVEALIGEFNSSPSTLVAAIGPSIGPCCYEVGEQVITAVRASFPNPEGLLLQGPNGSFHFDLWEANRRQMLGVGVPPSQIEVASICTADHTVAFFSHRAERGRTGRFAVAIGLR